ncbi:hypothetical protein P20652_2967 [Pseudoalteromonas sp. BSi20652]|uniref:hypothetical protein n=1 Tax=Pseudoalteromonas sp. BSi20652 TaxID=388384 RepID=UPI00023180E5|nr:hypothetical protein [Pseudoalteromonas sp. BSi20652]GAA61093.1 hypothetical protein P20652_2967 [Pseudoalteromonas sp. BSi20652]
MPLEVTNYLLIDIDNEFSRAFAEHYTTAPSKKTPSLLIAAGSNTRQLVRMMFDELIKDYSYCDLENEISVSELINYLTEHHNLQGVLFNSTDYLLASDKQRFIFNSLHENRFLISVDDTGYTVSPITDENLIKPSTANIDIAHTPQDLIELAEQINKNK